METVESWTLIALGVVLLASYAAHVLGTQIHVPRVTLLLLIGLVTGPAALNLIPEAVYNWFPMVAQMALGMVGFLLGERFVGREISRTGRMVLWISLSVTALAVVFVFTALILVGVPTAFALVMAGIAPATAPIAIYDLVREAGAKGPLTDTVLEVTAIDDAWGLILFSVLLVSAEGLLGGAAVGTQLLSGVIDMGAAVLLGGLLGLPMAWLTGRLREGEPSLVEGLGFVFLGCGIAAALNLSYLLTCMVMGAVVANRAKHYTRAFHEIEGVSEPFWAIFFVLAGAQFDLAALAGLGLAAMAYVIARTAGRVVGGRVGARIGRAPEVVRANVGWCLLPQAGVAVGLALMALERLPTVGNEILQLVIATTVLFEIIGPVITRLRLERAGEL